MQYERLILKILFEAGKDGLSVQKITNHVFNEVNTMFSAMEYSEIHVFVQKYLQRLGKNPQSPIEKTSRGIYRLKLNNTQSQQLFFDFSASSTDLSVEKETEDKSLNLFS